MESDLKKKKTLAPIGRKGLRKVIQGHDQDANQSSVGKQASPKLKVVIVPDAVDASSGVETPFGHRWWWSGMRLPGTWPGRPR
jgi:hypothetical protein